MHHLGFYTKELVETVLEPLGDSFHSSVDEYMKLVNDSLDFMKNMTHMKENKSVDGISVLTKFKKFVAENMLRYANESEFYFVKPENSSMEKELGITTIENSPAGQVSSILNHPIFQMQIEIKASNGLILKDLLALDPCWLTKSEGWGCFHRFS